MRLFFINMTQEPIKKEDNSKETILTMVSLVGELGLIFALPLAVLVPIVVKLDRVFATTPLLIIAGMVSSLLISTLLVRRKLKALL